jgi:hypothetical protein
MVTDNDVVGEGSRQAQLESRVRGNVPAPFGAGERLQSPTYRYPSFDSLTLHKRCRCTLEFRASD